MLLRLLDSFSEITFQVEQRDKEGSRDKSWHSTGDERTKRTKRWDSLAYQTKPGSRHSLAKAEPRWCSRDTSLCQLWRPQSPGRGRLLAWTVKSYNRNIWRMSGWDHVNSQKLSIRSENGLSPFEKTFFFNVATSKCITKQRQESNYPRGGCHEKSYFSQLLQCILRSSALCQVADKGRILHAWDHAARAIRLMGFDLNSRPAPLRRTDAGFFQMSVSTAPRVENGFMARKGRSDFSSWWSSSSLEVAFPLG